MGRVCPSAALASGVNSLDTVLRALTVDVICGLSGRWSIGPYCVDSSVVGGVVIVAALLLGLFLFTRMAEREGRARDLRCRDCGREWPTRHELIVHRHQDHPDHP